jgi:hypothetical protein
VSKYSAFSPICSQSKVDGDVESKNALQRTR